MSTPSSAFQEYLADDEPVITGTLGTLIDRSRRFDGSIGVTDRRVLFLSEQNRFMEFSFDAIDSIQSHLTATMTSRTIGYWGMIAFGVSIAILSVIGMLVIDSSILALSLIVLTVGGTVSAEYVRRYGLSTARTARYELAKRLRDFLDETGIRLRYLEIPFTGDNRDAVVLGLGLVAATALVGLVAITESLLVLPLVLLTLGGIAMTDYGKHRITALNANDKSRQYERAVSIHLSNGRIVRLRVDAATRIDHEISGLARETTRDHTNIEWPESNPDRTGGSPSTSRATHEPVDSTD